MRDGPPATVQPLLAQLHDRVDAALSRPALLDNVDPERFPDGMAPLDGGERTMRLRHLDDHAVDLDWLAGRLDADSRALLLDRLAFHALGHAHARVGPARRDVDTLLGAADRDLIVRRDMRPLRFAGSPHSHLFDLSGLGLPITLESYTLGVQGTMQLGQYRAPGHPEAWPRGGDVAIDAGGCFGETALWLAHAVGTRGRVVTLEFGKENLAVLHGNLRRNPRLGKRVTVVERALWSASDAELAIEMAGPASSVARGRTAGEDPAVQSARTITLDDLVIRERLPRVDFVKMDIEGAEPAALAAAGATLRRWRPRLALAVYHDISHIWRLPRLLDALDLGYHFALGHFTMHDEETVLYAWVPGEESGPAQRPVSTAS